MSRDFLLKTAEVLEKLAEQLDQEEVQRQKIAQTKRLRFAQELGEKVAQITGETLSSDVLEKIASSDEAVVAALTKLAERNMGPPDDLGGPSDIRDTNAIVATSRTERVKEASAHADDRFIDWIMS